MTPISESRGPVKRDQWGSKGTSIFPTTRTFREKSCRKRATSFQLQLSFLIGTTVGSALNPAFAHVSEQ
jgi:hypothetical protein